MKLNIPTTLAKIGTDKFSEPNEKVLELYPVESACEHCGLICARQLQITLITNPINTWRYKCVTCNQYQNPVQALHQQILIGRLSTV